MIRVRWTGAAGLELIEGGKAFLIDPYLSRPGKGVLLFGRPEARAEVIDRYLSSLPAELCAVMVGHTHLDHALDIPHLAGAYPGELLGSASLDTLMQMHGVAGRVRICQGGERVAIGPGVSATMIRSRHGRVLFGRVPFPGEVDSIKRPPLRMADYRLGAIFIVEIEIGGMVIMHVGSANFIPSELEGRRCDALFLCVPGWKRTPGYPGQLVEMVQPKLIVPFHHDDFSAPMKAEMRAPRLPGLAMEAFLRQLSLSAPAAEIRVPATYETMEL